MKTIYVVRHAKSSWQIIGQKDHERPLHKEGLKRMKKVNDYLVKNKVKPDMIISSHAVRAFETARLIASELAYPENQIMQDREIYLGNEDSLLQIVFSLPDHLESVMLVGHNPVITGFAQMFQARIPSDMPTSAVVSIGVDTKNWNQILIANKKVNFYIYPSML